MNFKSNLEVALNGIKANKLRSVLTMLGIIIGVSAVIIMISVGQGAGKRITDQISSMGSNMLMVMPGAEQRGPVRGAGGSVNTLTLDDARAIAKLDMVANVAPVVGGSATIAYGSGTWTSQYSGTTPELQQIRDFATASGSFFTDEDVNEATPVAVLGQTVVDNLYPAGTDPVGTKIRINTLSYTVVGVLASKGASMMGQDQDDVVYIPVTTAQRKMLGQKYVSQINVQAESQDSMEFVESSIETLLRERHDIQNNEDDDFNVRNQAELIETVESTSAVMTMMLASVAAVSLLVGGIGIMNIMLVSVTERTREIGLRMAVGATDSNIRNQFLVEALVLCMLGGIAGVLLGVTGSKLLSVLGGWSTSVTLASILMSVGFSAAVGVFFGYYPAKQAAALDPIEALRFEK
ncbi:putative ABC transport system permease protein [Desulfotomaculum arcticum]|uniref:Putative ABC transport system permease protein n=1 Tax=Desulfotruncus arcticus DSM 17038 TaxID=1121424 RepID=A0A1I2RL02_9FIRM|nr:ABC transporter permease [Desulfotruncus arcticus]SFG41130.1 putative ABC transport system permease protein [Desulfotomaculum arcticum] [Desulfotruncus arcticus DSM 17038]